MDELLRATADAEARHFWFRGFRLFVSPFLKQAAGGRRGGLLLDCGCGTGANLTLLAELGRAYGFDLAESGLRIGRARGQTRTARASVAAIPFPSGRFDVVTSFDVLYSLDASVERAAAAEMFRVLKPGGAAVVNVAAMQMLRGNHSVLSHEVRRYSRASLGALLTGAGFAVERITYTNASLFLPMLAARALQRARGLSASDSAASATEEITVPPAPVNALLTGVLSLESAWLSLGNSPFGSSLLCLARKPASAGT
ncbi:MAG TPA: class I SAM-dependent methyltransferase [Vicinamibacterales bacterium]|nr:class I SAM-dependent methyltransferase [Vicinamibacterales bacterium]